MREQELEKEAIAYTIGGFLLLFSLFVSGIAFEERQKYLQSQEERQAIEECLRKVKAYCVKNKNVEEVLSSKVCPLVKDRLYLWGDFKCRWGKLSQVWISSSSLSAYGSGGEVRLTERQ